MIKWKKEKHNGKICLFAVHAQTTNKNKNTYNNNKLKHKYKF